MQGLRKYSNAMWWLSLIMLILVALPIYWSGYNLDFDASDQMANYMDERILYKESFEMSRIPIEERELGGYPPGLLWIFQLAHQLTNSGDTLNNELVISLARLWTGLVNVCTIVLLAQIGRNLHSRLLGILTALAWLMAPLIVSRVWFALTEPYQVFFITLAVYTALTALKEESAPKAILSVLSALMAGIFKYSALSAIGFGTGVVFWFLCTDYRKSWRKWLATLGAQLSAITACAIWVYAYGIRNLADRPEASRFINNNTSGFGWAAFMRAVSAAISQLNWDLSLFVLVFIIGSFVFVYKKNNRLRYFWLMMTVYVLVYLGVMLTYIVYWVGVHRYTTTISPVIVLLIMGSLILIAEQIADFIASRNTLLRYTILLLFPAVWIIPMASSTIQQAQIRSYPIPNRLLANWSSYALPMGTILLPEYDITWVYFQYDHGYRGILRPWVAEQLETRSIEEWRSMYVPYVYLAEWRHTNMLNDPERKVYLDNMLLLKHFGTDGKTDGAPIYLYYLYPVDHYSEVTFGEDIRLYAYTINHTELSPDGEVSIQTFWQASNRPQTDYHLFVHLVAEDDLTPLAQYDGFPGLDSYRPTQWTDPKEVIIGQSINLHIPPDIRPGNYRIILGLYDSVSNIRLKIETGNDFYVLETITITDT